MNDYRNDDTSLIPDDEGNREIQTEQKIEEWMNREATIQCCCFKFQTTEKTKNRVYGQLLLLILFAQLGSSIAASYFVGSLGQTIVNIQSTVDNVFDYVNFVEVLLISGLTARISQARGENNPQKMRSFIILGMITSIFYGVVAAGLLVGLKDIIFNLVNQSQLSQKGTVYFYISAAALPFNFVENACLGIMLGLYELPYFTLSVFMAVAFEIFGNFLLIKVFSVGLEGVAIMNMSASLILFMITLLFFFRRDHVKKAHGFYFCGGDDEDDDNNNNNNSDDVIELLTTKRSKSKSGCLHQITQISTFMSDNIYLLIYDSLSSLTGLIIIPIALSLGPSQQTAISIFSNLGGLSNAIAKGLGLGVTMFGAILVAKGHLEILKRYVLVILIFSLVLTSAFSIVMIFAPGWITNIYYSSSENRKSVLNYLHSIWYIIVVIHPLNAILKTFEGLLFAYTEFKAVAIITVLATIVAYVPLVVVGKMYHSVYLVAMGAIAFTGIKATGFVGYYFGALYNKTTKKNS